MCSIANRVAMNGESRQSVPYGCGSRASQTFKRSECRADRRKEIRRDG